MTCPEQLGPGLAGLSAAIQTGAILGSELFAAWCVECPDDLPDSALQEVIDQIDERAMCQVMCCCRQPSQHQVCVKDTLDAADALLGGQSRYKAEISYNMQADPVPAPFMHREGGADTTRRSEYWQTRARQEIPGYRTDSGHVRRPDVVIVDDPTRAPTQDNIRRVVEMKFRGDREMPGQLDDYKEIAGKAENFSLIEERHCRCGEDHTGRPNPLPVAAPDGEPSAVWGALGIVAWGAATVVAGVATAVAVASPFEGPAGDIAFGTATAAAAVRFAAAWRAMFATAPAAGGAA